MQSERMLKLLPAKQTCCWKLKRMLKLLQNKLAADLKQKTDTGSCWGKSQAAADAQAKPI
jgi:hypothetical protein